MDEVNKGGAPLGNQNAVKGKRFQKAVERVLARKYGDVDKGYEALAEKYIEVAEAKDPNILKDVADRSDGKPTQTVAGDPNAPLVHKIERVIIDNAAPGNP